MTTTHTLPSGLVESMSGAGSRAETDLLRGGQLSKRLVQLRAILDLAGQDAPEDAQIAGLRESFAALAAIQRRAPDVVAGLLSGPQAGAWAARCLHRLAGSPSRTPLWIHLAHLGSIALAAAVRSGVDIDVLVPVRTGKVSLPTLGLATVDSGGPWALARAAPGDPVRLDGAKPLDWQPVRALETDAVTVYVDDADAYWTCFGLPVRYQVPGPEIDRWRRHLDGALAVLAERHPDRLAAVTSALQCLVPVDQQGRFAGVSASSAQAPGAVALTEPAGPQRFAATLVHEIQHFRLSALHDLVPVHQMETGPRVYSPWRNDPRGLPGLLHGTYAFLGVADFWSREWPGAGRAAELMYARTLRQLWIARRILATASALTPAGTALAEAVGEQIDRLPETGLSADIRRLAGDLTAHHLALWRLRYAEPDPAEVAAVADAWERGETVAPQGDPLYHTTAESAPGGDSPLFRLATEWVEDPATLTGLAADPVAFAAHCPGANPGDLALLAGDYRKVQAERLADIAAGTTDETGWASLSVAHARLCADPDRSPLAVRPELVRAARDDRRYLPLRDMVSRYITGTSTSDSIRR
ncbi:HEXXH motif domain-containing protein [Actinocrispum sp. NPDC049592]|uniref:HEXXH motif domain-containing protein n=1 Tax=Actinocrispum sp. NPDC049592 TaxID=3154835 RepID=UPI003420F8F0